jgi:hypothetical protein
MKAMSQPKQFSAIGRDAKGFFFLCYGPDLLTLRSDLNKALSTLKVPKVIEISDIHLRQNPCVIVKGKGEDLGTLKMYLATHERYIDRIPGAAQRLP